MKNIFTMVPLVSFLAALRILTEAQICNNGEGKIVYEKLLNSPANLVDPGLVTNASNVTSYELIVRKNLPLRVLEECFRTCQEDRTSKIAKCVRFDFIPGRRISEPSIAGTTDSKGVALSSLKVDHDESTCIFYETLNATAPNQIVNDNRITWHFNEICLNAQLIHRNCPNRFYVFESLASFKLLAENAKEMEVMDKNECENKCLNERAFTCRSASYLAASNRCYLSDTNRHVSPNDFKPDADYVYLENTCLKHHDMCKWNAFIIENEKQLDSSYEKLWVTASSVNTCSKTCLDSLDRYGFVCRSFMFNENTRQCVLYDEDPLEQFHAGNTSNIQLVKSQGNLYRVLCSTDDKDKYLDNKTLECYRHKRLRGRHQMELSISNFYDCLTSCLKKFGRNCRSIEYSHAQEICRFSDRFVVGPLTINDKEALVDDDHFDYYQFMWNDQQESRAESRYSSYDRPALDRLDSIEVSNSNPKVNYGSYLPPPVQQTRDHHRGGFSYAENELPRKTVAVHSVVRENSRHPSGHTSVSYPGGQTPLSYSGGHTSQPYPSFQNREDPGHLQGPSSYSAPSNRDEVKSYQPAPTVSHRRPHQYYPDNTGSMGRTPFQNRFMSMVPPPYASSNTNSMSHAKYPPVMGPHGPGMVSPQMYDSPDQKDQNSIQSPGCKNDGSLGESSQFRRVGFSTRLKSKHIYKVVRADKLEDCERFCVETKDFVCKSFNFRAFFPDNCELSSVDTKKYKSDNPEHFEHDTQFDYYERIEHKSLISSNSMDCFEVLQSCSPEGMELKLKTTDGFFGRIYTYGFYDSCFFDGTGATTNMLRISKPNGFPRCGTQQVGDAMTNIVVVQFNDYVQTSRDKKYNLTCFISGPGEAVVTSNYLDTKTDGRHPMQIEHLPAQNILTSNIILRILYRGTPTNTIVVGDLLTFRLEARSQYRLNGYQNDIFATNVIAKDPYTGKQVLLIDSRGCPVDLFVFPELHKTADGALEAEFYAFKIPDSNFLVFQATVKTCKGPCEQVICTDKGRGQNTFPSSGRRKRAVPFGTRRKNTTRAANGDEEEVHELLRVYLSHDEMPEPEESTGNVVEKTNEAKVCVDRFSLYSMVSLSTLFILFFIILLPYFGLVKLVKFKYNNKALSPLSNLTSLKWTTSSRPSLYPASSSSSSSRYSCQSSTSPAHLDSSISGPVYDKFAPCFERSRSMQSLTVPQHLPQRH